MCAYGRFQQLPTVVLASSICSVTHSRQFFSSFTSFVPDHSRHRTETICTILNKFLPRSSRHLVVSWVPVNALSAFIYWIFDIFWGTFLSVIGGLPSWIRTMCNILNRSHGIKLPQRKGVKLDDSFPSLHHILRIYHENIWNGYDSIYSHIWKNYWVAGRGSRNVNKICHQFYFGSCTSGSKLFDRKWGHNLLSLCLQKAFTVLI